MRSRFKPINKVNLKIDRLSIRLMVVEKHQTVLTLDNANEII